MEVIIMQNTIPDAPYIIEMSRDTPSRPHPIVDEEPYFDCNEDLYGEGYAIYPEDEEDDPCD